jgi:hypothetical protein
MNDALTLLLAHPDPTIRKHATTIKEATDRRNRILKLVQEALSQLRVDMKYLVFDLECTRRERDELRKEKNETPTLSYMSRRA